MGPAGAVGGVGALGAGVGALDANSGGGGGMLSSSLSSSILHSTRQSSLTIIIFAAKRKRMLVFTCMKLDERRQSNQKEHLYKTNAKSLSHTLSYTPAADCKHGECNSKRSTGSTTCSLVPKKEVIPKSVNSSWSF